MIDTIAAGRYTRALFELAEQENKLAEIEDALKLLKDSTVAQPKILSLVANPTLSDDEKFHLIQNIMPGKVPELLSHFFKVLLEKKRFALLPTIQSLFHNLYEKKHGIQDVELISPVPFSPTFMEKVKAVLKKKLRSEILLITKIDPRLLGGFLLRFAGKEIDCSFKNRIHEIQQKLFSIEPMSS